MCANGSGTGQRRWNTAAVSRLAGFYPVGDPCRCRSRPSGNAPLLFYREISRIVLVEEQRERDMSGRIDLPQGTLDLLIMKTLSLAAMHGWAISERIRQVSRDALSIPQGSLYPALHRLERQGWISAEWGASENNRKAKFYKLTVAGRKQLASDSQAWSKVTAAVDLVMEMGR
jgi:transcriptional regulator